MAYLEYHSGRKQLVPPQKAELLWRIHSGNLQPTTTAELEFAYSLRKRVKKIVLNWHTAPEAYIWAHLDEIIPSALDEWSKDYHGQPIRPASNRAWQFAKKYGLWKSGKPGNRISRQQVELLL